MASLEMQLLDKCLNLVHGIIGLNQRLNVNVKIGDNFNFEFCNMEKGNINSLRKISPSQQRRNHLRKLNFEQNKLIELRRQDKLDLVKLKEEDETQVVEKEIQVKVNQLEIGSNTEDLAVEKLDKSIQVAVDNIEVGVNTEVVTVDKYEDALNMDKNGNINPTCDDEVLIEMSVSHDVKTWEDISHIVKEKLKMIIRGRPWIANNGRLYKTIGFRTAEADYERWKLNTFNWQDSGVRRVTTSRLYR